MAKKVKLNVKCELLLHYLEKKLTVSQLLQYAEEKYDLKVSRQSIGKWISQKDEIIASQNIIGKLKTRKGSSDQSHFTFEIIVGKNQIRYGTTLNLNVVILNRF